MLTAQHARTSLALGAAGATVLAALWLGPSLVSNPTADAPAAAAVPALPASDPGVAIDARLQASSVAPGAHDEDVVVDLRAVDVGARVRPPLTLAVVIDRSGSMEGQPLANAKHAAMRLVDDLAPTDTFSIVTFSSGAEVVSTMAPATAANKARARAAIDKIYDDGGTCTSCGLDRAVDELSHGTSQDAGVHRIVLISDGHANEGVWDKGQLVELASKIASHGTSITTVGVGLDFDEVTMTKIAEVGRGNYYFVEDTANLGVMFGHELGGLADTVASDVHLTLRDLPGAVATEAFGYPATREGGALVIPIADLRAGETRKVVVRVHVSGAIAAGAQIVAEPIVGWRAIGATTTPARHAYARLTANITADAAEIAASVDRAALQEVEEARSARAMEEATIVYETQGAAAAQKVLQDHAAAAHIRAKALPAAAMKELDAASGDAMEMLKLPPAKATKAMRVKSYELSR